MKQTLNDAFRSIFQFWPREVPLRPTLCASVFGRRAVCACHIDTISSAAIVELRYAASSSCIVTVPVLWRPMLFVRLAAAS